MADGDVIYANGWEVGDPTKEAGSLTTSGGTATATATNAQTGDYCLRLNRTSAAALTFAQYVNSTPTGNAVWPAGIRQVAVSFSLYVAALPSSGTDTPLFWLTHFSGNDATLTLNSSGELKLQVVGQTISGVIATLSAGSRYLIEWRDDTSATGHNLYARVDGGTEVSSTSGSEGANDVSGFDLGQYGTASNTWDLYIDDLVVVQGTSYPSDLFGGEPRVLPVYPDAGASNIDTTWTISAGGGTSRAAVIDESPPDDSTSYITGSSSGAVQRIPMADTTVDGTPVAVNLRVRSGSNSTTGTRNFTANIRDGSAGSDGASSTLSYDVNGWINVHHTTPLMDVPGGSGWTQTDVDNLVARLVKDANTNQVRVTWLIAQVVYVPSSAVSDTPLTGGATAGGSAPGVKVASTSSGAVGGGPAPVARAAVATGGAAGGGAAAGASAAVATAGALAGGVSPVDAASDAATPAGASAGGVAPAVAAAVDQGGVIGSGAAPAVIVPVDVGGAVVGGFAATDAASDTAGVGGAVAGGFAPTIAPVPVALGGALAGGASPGASVSVSTGGASTGSNAPGEALSESVTPGGALGAGVEPEVAVGVDSAGALGGSADPAVRVDVGRAGALAGGVVVVASGEDAAGRGGALAAGVELAGVAAALEPISGAVVGGTPPEVSATIEPAGAVGSGRAPAVTAPATSGGATAGGVAPGESLSESPTPGGADAGGVAVGGAVVGVLSGGATAGGITPSDGFTSGDVSDVGGAVGGGVEPSAAVSLAAGGAVAGGTPPLDGLSESAGRGGATGGGVEPTARITATIGAAIASGVAASVRVDVTPSGASAGGVVVGEGGGEVAGRGGALGGGVEPTAWVDGSGSVGGASAGGRSPSAWAGGASPGGAVGSGASASGVAVAVGVGGGVAGGRTMTDPDTSLHVAGGGVPRMGLGTLEVV